MKTRILPLYAYISLIVLAVVALFGVFQRYQVEARNRSVCPVAEEEIISGLATSSGVSMGSALTELRTDGLRGIVLTEETIGSWLSEGRLVAQTATDPTSTTRTDFTLSGSIADIQTVVQAIGVRFPGVHGTVSGDGKSITFVHLSTNVLRNVSLGIDPVAASRALAHHLIIIARLGNPLGIRDQNIKSLIALTRERGATVFLPQGSQVLGRRKGIQTMTKALKSNGMLYASPEFAKIGGDSEVVSMAPQIVIRLHSAQIAELDKDTFQAAVERFTKAARERNMRILLLRPLDFASENPLRDFGHFIHTIAKGLAKQGQVLGSPHPFTEPKTPKLFYPILGLCLVPIVWALCVEFIPVIALPVTAFTILCALAALSPTHRNPIAFLIALAIPCLAFMSMEPLSKKPIWIAYIGTCLISLVGGLAIGAMLSQLRYYVRAQEFQGVKIAVFLPILAAGWYFLDRFGNLKKVSRDPITIRAAFFGLIVFGILGYMFLRTGNSNPAVVSPIELKMRNLLDHFVFVRPRTKSFLIGLPALYIALQMLRKYLKSGENLIPGFGAWTALALAAAMISQTDIVNTFCHIHTPVLLSAERIGVELIMGGIIGFVGWLIIDFFLKKAGSIGLNSPRTEPSVSENP